MYTVSLIDNISKKEIWNLKLDNLELVAGILAASVSILGQMNYESNTEYYVDSNTDLSKFRLLKDIKEDDISTTNLDNILPGTYAVWMKSNQRFYYNLFTFKNNSFFQGIFTICDAFKIDFRTCIYRYPFDSNGKEFTLQGYPIIQREISIHIKDHEDDEERGNENVIQLLRVGDEVAY